MLLLDFANKDLFNLDLMSQGKLPLGFCWTLTWQSYFIAQDGREEPVTEWHYLNWIWIHCKE